MDLIERFSKCAGMTTAAIGAEFAADDFDEVCRTLLTIFAERTDVRRLSTMPATIRVTMYGDEDVADYVIRYGSDGYTIDPPRDDDVLDAHLRWEHWEDAVRLFNADIPASTVLFSFRVTFDGQKEGGSQRTAALAWMAAANFADLPPEQRSGGSLYRLQWLTRYEPHNIPAYVDQIGLQTLVSARAEVLGRTFVEVGAKDEVQGSYLRFDVAGNPPTSARVDWDADTAEITVSQPDPATVDDPEGGVTLRYADPETFLEVAGLKTTGVAAMAAGKVAMRASAERSANYQKAMLHLARHLS